MRWYDVFRDNERNQAALAEWQAALAAGQRDAQPPPPTIEVEGLVFRLDDGTPAGAYRVCAEDPARKSWAIYDMRRGLRQPRALATGIADRDRAILIASLFVQSRPARALAVGWRRMKGAGMLLASIPEAVREEWWTR